MYEWNSEHKRGIPVNPKNNQSRSASSSPTGSSKSSGQTSSTSDGSARAGAPSQQKSILNQRIKPTSMPRALAKELREATESRRAGMPAPYPGNGPSAASAVHHSRKSQRQKGCICQLGSGFKAVLILVAMVSVTTGVVWWLYENKFSTEARNQNRVTGQRQGRANVPLGVGENGTTESDNDNIVRDNGLEMDITFKSEKVLNDSSSSSDVQLPKVCLLYTSPSPRDRQKSRMPSSA